MGHPRVSEKYTEKKSKKQEKRCCSDVLGLAEICVEKEKWTYNVIVPSNESWKAFVRKISKAQSSRFVFTKQESGCVCLIKASVVESDSRTSDWH